MKNGKIVVALLINDLGIGGSARHQNSILNNINRDFFEPYIISLTKKDDARSQYSKGTVLFISDPITIAWELRGRRTDIMFFQRGGRNEPAHDQIAFYATQVNPNISIVEQNTFSFLDKG